MTKMVTNTKNALMTSHVIFCLRQQLFVFPHSFLSDVFVFRPAQIAKWVRVKTLSGSKCAKIINRQVFTIFFLFLSRNIIFKYCFTGQKWCCSFKITAFVITTHIIT